MHIAIILDGNGRWATSQNQPRLFGHNAGVQALKRLAKDCPRLGVTTLTVYAFAIANWKRDKKEVDGLWKLFHDFFENEIEELIANGIRIKVIGNRAGLPQNIKTICAQCEVRSKNNSDALLQIALNYDGIDEIARLVQRTLAANLSPAEVTTGYVQNNLDTEPADEPDIVIRTGMPKPGDQLATWRSSAFLPIQSAQSVCVSTTTLWPDFSSDELQKIITFADPKARLFGGQRREV